MSPVSNVLDVGGVAMVSRPQRTPDGETVNVVRPLTSLTVDGITYYGGTCVARTMIEVLEDGGSGQPARLRYDKPPPTDEELSYFVATGRHPR